jgi:lipoprotein-releasing system permease protein
MNWKIYVGLRYLTRKSKERFISIISVISILGVIVGVSALIVVLSIMTGFDTEIKEKIIGTYSHMILLNEAGIENEKDVMDTLNKNKHVLASSPFIERTAFLKHEGGAAGVMVRGLDEAREKHVSNVSRYIEGGVLDFGKDRRGMILGRELLKSLNLKKNDKISLVLPDGRSKKDFTVAGTFTSGRYDYDANLVFISLKTAKEFFNARMVTGIGMRVDNEFKVNSIKRELQGTFRYPFTIRSWMDLDKNLMRALAIEKKMMFIILALIIMVACFNIASSLIMQVLDKTRDIGVLRAIGATAGDIKKIFIFLGFSVGLIGVVFGGILGVFLARNINTIADYAESITGFELFPSDIYYLNSIPVKIVASDIAVIAMFSLILAVMASFYPAWRASRLNPVKAIRYE